MKKYKFVIIVYVYNQILGGYLQIHPPLSCCGRESSNKGGPPALSACPLPLSSPAPVSHISPLLPGPAPIPVPALPPFAPDTQSLAPAPFPCPRFPCTWPLLPLPHQCLPTLLPAHLTPCCPVPASYCPCPPCLCLAPVSCYPIPSSLLPMLSQTLPLTFCCYILLWL